MKFAIVNADDFGLTSGINRGIIEAHEKGIVTSTSLMVRHSTAREAAALAAKHPKLSIGLHFDIAEWQYESGNWIARYQIIDPRNAEAVEKEVQNQLETFQQLMNQAPTHIDSHQHVHNSEPAREILLRASEELAVPLRGCTWEIKHAGAFYGQTAEGAPFPEGISIARLDEMLARIGHGWTEIGCHPGYASDLDSVYRGEREIELRVLCDEEIRRSLKQSEVELASFRDFNEMRARPQSSD